MSITKTSVTDRNLDQTIHVLASDLKFSLFIFSHKSPNMVKVKLTEKTGICRTSEQRTDILMAKIADLVLTNCRTAALKMLTKNKNSVRNA